MGRSIYIYQQSPDGTYTETQVVNAVFIVKLLSCSDGMIIASLTRKKIKIFAGENYETVQTIDNSERVGKIASNEDFEMFAAGRADGSVHIYQRNGSQFQLSQQLNVGFTATGLVLNSERLIASGLSTDIHIYEFNGSGYWLRQVIHTN